MEAKRIQLPEVMPDIINWMEQTIKEFHVKVAKERERLISEGAVIETTVIDYYEDDCITKNTFTLTATFYPPKAIIANA